MTHTYISSVMAIRHKKFGAIMSYTFMPFCLKSASHLQARMSAPPHVTCDIGASNCATLRYSEVLDWRLDGRCGRDEVRP